MPNQVLFGGDPAWVLKGASLDMDFANGRSFVRNGSKGFTSLLSCTRAQTVNSYALNSSGILVPFAANALRITDLGLLVEQASTNLCLWSRDMTNAAWVKVTMTAALTATGADGVANSASTLTATAGNGTILQPITLGSAGDTYSVWLKRVSGSGTIQISENGGTGWTTVVLTTSYQQFQITATLPNPSVGIRIVTNGDVIAADFNGLESNAFATSPIPTTTASVARAADVNSLAGQAVTLALNAKSSFFQTNSGQGISTSARLLDVGGVQTFAFPSTTTVQLGSGANNATATIGGAGVYAGPVKSAFGFDTTSMTAVANSGTKVTNANTYGSASTPIIVGNRGDGARALNGFMQRLTIGPTKGQFDGLTV